MLSFLLNSVNSTFYIKSYGIISSYSVIYILYMYFHFCNVALYIALYCIALCCVRVIFHMIRSFFSL